MKRIVILASGQLILCLLCTYLISKISLIGRIGIATVHREYRLLRSGWKTFFLFWGLELLVIGILSLTEKKSSPKTTVLFSWLLLAVAIAGLLLTYLDFLHTYSHRLLKERFHLGFYLFWLGWMATCVVFLRKARTGLSSAARWPEDERMEEWKKDQP